MQKRDHYVVLNIKPVSTPDEIRKAYRELSKKYHPDLNPGKKVASDDKMKALVAAYSILNDKAKRKEYDNQAFFQFRRFAKGREKPKKSDFSKKKKKKDSFIKKFLGFFSKGEAAKGIDPKQADVHFMLGLSMSETEQFLPQAKEEFKKALEYDAKHLEATYNLALAAYKIGDFDEARLGLQDVLKLNSNDQHAKHLLRMLHEPDL